MAMSSKEEQRGVNKDEGKRRGAKRSEELHQALLLATIHLSHCVVPSSNLGSLLLPCWNRLALLKLYNAAPGWASYTTLLLNLPL